MTEPTSVFQQDAHFWARAWEAARERSLGARRAARDEEEMVAAWNRRAPRWARRTGSEAAHQRRREILAWLEQEGALRRGIRVLDIGAGPGNFAIPIAKIAAEVVALEPAAAMLDLLKERAVKENLSNIHYLACTWQQVDLEKEGLTGGFDLVLASMTPGVRDAATLEKMMAASRGFCYYSGFAGGFPRTAEGELWQKIVGEAPRHLRGDILPVFVYLYALGYRPRVRFMTMEMNEEIPVEEAVAELSDFFARHEEVTEEVKRVIRDYVKSRAVDGFYRRSRRACHGLLLWRVDEKWTAGGMY